MNKLKEHPTRKALKEKSKQISITRTKYVRSSKLSVYNRELKVLNNVLTTLNIIPSIIDYAVNVGLQETSNQWLQHLKKNGDLSKDLYLNAVLDFPFAKFPSA
jgi:hypothetical protein